jgi:hypothetical protein
MPEYILGNLSERRTQHKLITALAISFSQRPSQMLSVMMGMQALFIWSFVMQHVTLHTLREKKWGRISEGCLKVVSLLPISLCRDLIHNSWKIFMPDLKIFIRPLMCCSGIPHSGHFHQATKLQSHIGHVSNSSRSCQRMATSRGHANGVPAKLKSQMASAICYNNDIFFHVILQCSLYYITNIVWSSVGVKLTRKDCKCLPTHPIRTLPSPYSSSPTLSPPYHTPLGWSFEHVWAMTLKQGRESLVWAISVSVPLWQKSPSVLKGLTVNSVLLPGGILNWLSYQRFLSTNIPSKVRDWDQIEGKCLQ